MAKPFTLKFTRRSLLSATTATLMVATFFHRVGGHKLIESSHYGKSHDKISKASI